MVTNCFMWLSVELSGNLIIVVKQLIRLGLLRNKKPIQEYKNEITFNRRIADRPQH